MAPLEPPHGDNVLPEGLEYKGNGVYQVGDLGNPMVSLDGYKILGLPYPEAAGFWSDSIASQKGYEAMPPATSVSVDTDVSGSVG